MNAPTRTAIPVLIETLWNVKSTVPQSGLTCCSVLIETLWNVKFDAFSRERVCSRIYRNIVECKVGRGKKEKT